MQRFKAIAAQVAQTVPTFADADADDLLHTTERLREQVRSGRSLDELLPIAFANCCAAAHKQVGITYRNTQVLAGAAMHAGMVVEMKTGEGKTLAAALPAYLNALTGRGVHIATANPYLAERDADLVGHIYRALGLSSAAVLPDHTPSARRLAYSADVTYGTATEFGFDYLRDHMVHDADGTVQGGDFHYIIVDEADSVLVDESSTPLIISDNATVDGQAALWADYVVRQWKEGVHYQVDREHGTAWPEDEGYEHAAALLADDSALHAAGNPFIGALHNAVKAYGLYRADVEYLVEDNAVKVIDAHTGRILTGRQYNGGLHQAIEAKEQVPLQAESTVQATIAIHNYMRLYERMAGMTGTATGLERELRTVYGTDVVRVPTFQTVNRHTPPPRIYSDQSAQLAALADDVAERISRGQPVLVGTSTVAESITVAIHLRGRGLDPRVLNATTAELEAEVISEAGQPGQLTVATNMAGRGTDILLGADPARAGSAVGELLASEVKGVGGLCVIGTALNVSARVDEQLKGRCARQGDPGEAYFYYRCDDERLLDNCPTEIPKVNGVEQLPASFGKYFTSAQSHDAAVGAEVREQTRKYDDVLDAQRRTVYSQRDRILNGDNDSEFLWQMIEATLQDMVDEWIADEATAPEELWDRARGLWPTMPAYPGRRGGNAHRWLLSMFNARYDSLRDAWTSEVGDLGWLVYTRRIILTCIDAGWRQHLDGVEGLRDAAALRATAGKDIHIEYADETTRLYDDMLVAVREMVTRYFYTSGAPSA